MSEWVSEGVSEWFLLNASSAIIQLYPVNFQWDDDEVRIVLDQYAELDFYSASSLKQQSSDRHVAPLGRIILIPSQPVKFLLIIMVVGASVSRKRHPHYHILPVIMFEIYKCYDKSNKYHKIVYKYLDMFLNLQN